MMNSLILLTDVFVKFQYGIGTMEIKTGYALSIDGEIQLVGLFTRRNIFLDYGFSVP